MNRLDRTGLDAIVKKIRHIREFEVCQIIVFQFRLNEDSRARCRADPINLYPIVVAQSVFTWLCYKIRKHYNECRALSDDR